MNNIKTNQLAQSASALGAGILGFGIGARWASTMFSYSLIIIIVGAFFHVFGMYIMQMKNAPLASGIAKVIWISAWICLIALVLLIVYLLLVAH
jgi:hypothetical protein